MGDGFLNAVMGALLGSGIATTILGAALLRRSERIGAEVRSQRAFQEAALEQLFGPVMMQLGRTRRAYGRWRERNEHIEGVIVRQGNQLIRDLLLTKGHLIPPRLVAPAEALIEHYDAWLEEYENVRVKQPDSRVEFVFVGTKGFPFPRAAEAQFIEYARQLQEALYGEAMLTG